ncbi:hypothetical protein [Sphingomonas alba]|uniref:Circumsporozoite protein n=1 Tax=Sphingomonas alba TaxID=2908208 RepID=A0ABT0RJW3_9SPHN|nr:hypothetical protein [Sphingomonas alba]MCL6682924.1 hypothetical protein [Sphingomonas alba]
MRALILVAGAALALSACSKNEAADNTMNVDDTMTTNEVLANDTMNTDMNAVDANSAMNAADTANAAADTANAAANTANAAANNAQ